MSGFIYIWRDRKKNRYYVGSHWGAEDDGYVCSSTWMLQAYRRRPQDFKRRILERFEDRAMSHEVEHRWLQMMKPEELRQRYYNLCNRRFGHWSTDERSRKSVGQKIASSPGWREKLSRSLKGKPFSEDHRKNISLAAKTRKTRSLSAETKEKIRQAQVGKINGDPEARRAASERRRGVKLSVEHRKKISEGRKRAWEGRI